MAVKKVVNRAAREKVIAPPEETADLRFRESGQTSPYRDLLDNLQDAPKGSTLRIARQARYTAVKHIRDLGLKVLWARKGEWLYIRIVGSVEDLERPLTIPAAVKEAAADKLKLAPPKNPLEEAMVLRALAEGPMTLKEMARVLAVAPTSLAGTLSRMVGQRKIENDGGVFRRLAA